MTEIDESMIMDPELSDYQMTDKPNENASSHQNSLLIQPASADCCAYLCTFCPCTSFASMELLERHICEEHHPTKQHNDNSNNNICELDEMEEKPIKTSATEDMASSQQQNGSSAFHVEFGSPLTTSTVAPHSPVDSSVASSFSTSTAAEAGSLGEQNKLLLLADLLTCKKCPGGRTFDSRDLLDQHCASTHRDRPQYACSQCGAMFSIKRELATHSRIHSGEQPHQCEKCGKEFGTRQLLKKHNMWHVGERSHVCPHCGKAFFQKGHLTQHLMIHKGGRPHKCNLCEKTFIFKFDLNRHVKIHSERNFLCKRCSKCFQLECELAEHAPKCKGTPASVAGQQQAQSQSKESRRGGKSSRQKSKQSSSVNCSPMSGAGSSPSSLLANAAGNWAAEEIKEEPKFEDMDTSAEQQELFPSVQSQQSEQTQMSPTGLLCCPGTDDEEGLANFAFSAAIESLNNQRNNNSQQLSVGHLAASLLASQRQNVGIGAAGFQQQNGQRQQQQQQFPCLLCPQKFPNQAAYLFHWGLAHMRDCAVGPAANAAFNQQMEEQRSFAHNLFQQKLLAGLGDPLLHLNAPIGTSCASSPQKVSPSSSSTSSSSSSAATTECHLLNLPLGQLEHFPGLAGLRQPAHFPAGCSNCPLERQRLAEKERELADTRAQLDRIRGLFLHLDSMLAAGGGNGTTSLSAAAFQAIPPPFGGNGTLCVCCSQVNIAPKSL